MTAYLLYPGDEDWALDVGLRCKAELPGEWYWWDERAANGVVPCFRFYLHWSFKVPPSIWQHSEAVNFHAAPLPWGRGGNVIEHQLLLGKTETVITAHRMTGELDAGPVYAVRGPVSLAGTREQILARFTAPVFDLIRFIVETEPEPQPQVGEVVTFKRLPPDEYRRFWEGRT